jgi:hypothetical protein
MPIAPRKLGIVLVALVPFTMGVAALLVAALVSAGACQLVFNGAPGPGWRDADAMWQLSGATVLLLAFAAVQLWGALRIWRRAFRTGSADDPIVPEV